MYGLLLACIEHKEASYCIVQIFEPAELLGHRLFNTMECPYLFAKGRFEVVPSVNILAGVSIVHECGKETCKLNTAAKTLEHDETNNLYILNIYSLCNY